MEQFFTVLTQGAFTILLTVAIVALFLIALGWLTVWCIRAFRGMAIHLGMAAREPKEEIMKRYKKRAKLLKFERPAVNG